MKNRYNKIIKRVEVKSFKHLKDIQVILVTIKWEISVAYIQVVRVNIRPQQRKTRVEYCGFNGIRLYARNTKVKGCYGSH